MARLGDNRDDADDAEEESDATREEEEEEDGEGDDEVDDEEEDEVEEEKELPELGYNECRLDGESKVNCPTCDARLGVPRGSTPPFRFTCPQCENKIRVVGGLGASQQAIGSRI